LSTPPPHRSPLLRTNVPVGGPAVIFVASGHTVIVQAFSHADAVELIADWQIQHPHWPVGLAILPDTILDTLCSNPPPSDPHHPPPTFEDIPS